VIDALDTSLERFLRRVVPLEMGQVDVVFGAPDRDWSAQRSRPTVGLFLHSVNPAFSRAKAGVKQTTEAESIKRATVVPVMALRYMVTVWVADPFDEHRLLGGVLRTLATTRRLPEQDLEPEVKLLGALPELSLVGEKDAPLMDLWSALGVSPRASIDLTVYVPAGAPVPTETAAPPSEVILDTESLTENPVRSGRQRIAGRVSPDLAGHLIVSPRGSAIVDKAGRFSVSASSLEELRLVTDDDPDGLPVVPYRED
jgi:hypothetical protein